MQSDVAEDPPEIQMLKPRVFEEFRNMRMEQRPLEVRLTITYSSHLKSALRQPR